MIKTLSFYQIRHEKLTLENNILNVKKIEYIDNDTQKSGLYTLTISNYLVEIESDLLEGNLNFIVPLEDSVEVVDCFFKYLYYYSCQLSDHFGLISSIIGPTLHFSDYTHFHKFIIKEIKNIFINHSERGPFTYAIIKNPDHEYTDQLIDLLIDNQYIITNKDINVAKLIMIDNISPTISYNNGVLFFSNVVELLLDIKNIICNYLIHLILYEKSPNYYKVYNKMINYYY